MNDNKMIDRDAVRTPWLALGLIVFTMNFAWEMAQGGLFANMRALPFWTATRRCLLASLGDLVIASLAFLCAATVVRDVRWPIRKPVFVSLTLFLASGILVAIVIEKSAVATGRWSYGAHMPTIAGVGLLPLLQWLLLPAFEVLAFRWLSRTRKHSS